MSGAVIIVLVHQTVVQAGNTVSGMVLLRVPAKQCLSCTSIEIRLFGQEKTESIHGGSSRDVHTFLNVEQRLQVVLAEAISTGECLFPFEFSIPDGAPASMAIAINENRVSIEYLLNAYTVGKDVVRGSAPVNVKRASVGVPIAFYALPKRTALTSATSVSGEILVGGAIETVGTSSYAKFAVVNRSEVKVKAVEATVVEEITFSTPEIPHKRMELIIFQKRVTSRECTLGRKSEPGATEEADLRILHEILCGDDHRMLLTYEPKPLPSLKDYQGGPLGTYEGTIMKITYRMHIRVYMKNCYAEHTVCGGDFVLIPSPECTPTTKSPFRFQAPEDSTTPSGQTSLPVATSTVQLAGAAPVAVAAPYDESAVRTNRSTASVLRSAVRTVFRLHPRRAPTEAEAQVADPSGLSSTSGDDVVLAAPATPLDNILDRVSAGGAISKQEHLSAVDVGVDPLLFSSAPMSVLDSTSSAAYNQHHLHHQQQQQVPIHQYNINNSSQGGPGGATICRKPSSTVESENYNTKASSSASSPAPSRAPAPAPVPGVSREEITQAAEQLISALKNSISPLGELRRWVGAGHTVDSLEPVHIFRIFAVTKQPVEQLRLADYLSVRLNTITCKMLKEAAAGSCVSCKREVVQKLLLSGPLIDRAHNWDIVAEQFSELEQLTLKQHISS